MGTRANRLVALFAVVLLVSAACSVKSIQDEPVVLPGAAAAADAEGSIQVDGASVVEVTVSEFSIEMSQTEFEVGVDYVFEVANDGIVAHEFMFIHPMEFAKTPSMAEIDEMAVVVIGTDELAPGSMVTRTVSFDAPGEAGLEAACYVPGHYEAGMVLPITVVS